MVAKIRGCKDASKEGSPLQGAACTDQCELFRTCKIKREPLLVNTIDMQGAFVKAKRRQTTFQIKEYPIWHSGHADYVRFNPDSEINGRFDDEMLR